MVIITGEETVTEVNNLLKVTKLQIGFKSSPESSYFILLCFVLGAVRGTSGGTHGSVHTGQVSYHWATHAMPRVCS